MHASFWVAECNIVHTSCTVLCSEHLVKKFFPHQFHQQFRIIFFTEHARQYFHSGYTFVKQKLCIQWEGPTHYLFLHWQGKSSQFSESTSAHHVLCALHCTLYAHRCRCLLVHIIHCPLRFMHKAHCSVECSNGTAFQNRLTKTGEFNAAQASV